MSRLFLVVLFLSLFAITGWSIAAEPTTAELEWHIKALESDMARMLSESQLLQVKFNAAQAELLPLIAERDKRKEEAKVKDTEKAKADAEKANPAK